MGVITQGVNTICTEVTHNDTRDELVEQIDGVDHSGSECECDQSDDIEYKE